jgi:multidrug efflux pump subunit AcrA (membrane-fusion protein)
VKLRATDRSSAATTQPLEGQIRLIGQRVDPATRLANVIVTLPPDAHLMLETYVAGEITRASADDALLVPRDAVLSDESGESVVFTVKDNKAFKHSVRIGLEDDRQTQVIADDLKEGDSVIILGNYALEDGAAVTPHARETTTTATTTTSPAGAAEADK